MAGFSFKNVKTPSLRNMMKKMQKPSEGAEVEQVEAATEQAQVEATPGPVLLNYADAREQVIASSSKSLPNPSTRTPDKAKTDPQATVPSPTSSSPLSEGVAELAGGAAANVKAAVADVSTTIEQTKSVVEGEVKAGVDNLQAQLTQALDSASSPLKKAVEDEGFILLDTAKRALPSSPSPSPTSPSPASPKALPESLDDILQGGAAGLSERVAVAREQAGTAASAVTEAVTEAVTGATDAVEQEVVAVGAKVEALVTEATDTLSGKADSLRSQGQALVETLHDQGTQAQSDVSDAVSARAAALTSPNPSYTSQASATSVKSTTSATSATSASSVKSKGKGSNTKEVSFTGLGEEEEGEETADSVLNQAKQPSSSSPSGSVDMPLPLEMDTLLRADSVQDDTPLDNNTQVLEPVSFLAAALSSATTTAPPNNSTNTNMTQQSHLTGGAAVTAHRESGSLSLLSEDDAPPSPHPGGAEGDAPLKEEEEEASVEANLDSMARHVAAMINDADITDTEKAASDIIATSTEKAAGVVVMTGSTEEKEKADELGDLAVPVDGLGGDKEVTLSGEERIGQGLLSPPSDNDNDNDKEGEGVKGLMATRGGASSKDDEAQASPAPSPPSPLLSLPLLLGVALLSLLVLTATLLYGLSAPNPPLAPPAPLLLPAHTPFQIRDGVSGLCLGGAVFGPCTGNKAAPTFTLTRVDLGGSSANVLQVGPIAKKNKNKCLIVNVSRNNKRSLGVGNCGDVSKAAGWTMADGALVHNTHNVALAKKGDKAELVSVEGEAIEGGLQLHGLVAPQADDQDPITFHSFDNIAL